MKNLFKKRKMENNENGASLQIEDLSVDEKIEIISDSIRKYGFDDGLQHGVRTIQNKERYVKVNYTLKCFHKEGVLAIFQAVEKITGDVDLSGNRGASGEAPPQYIDISLPNGESVKVPIGTIKLPMYGSKSQITLSYDWEELQLAVYGDVKQNYVPYFDAIIKEANKILRTNSLYTGTAIRLDVDDGYGEFKEPTFINLDNINTDEIILSKEAKDGLIPILTRIKHPERCLKEGLSLKYGALIEGPYGTGKTLLAFLVAKLAVQEGSTFIYLSNCKYAAKTLEIAENYAQNGKPVIVFTEDIDQALRGERDDSMQEILNTIDGGDKKEIPIISLFTTNHIELIEPTFLRGKRIGGLISLGALDEETALEFINKFIRQSDSIKIQDSEIDKAANALVGIVPAFASEIIDKAKTYMIERQDEYITGDDIKIVADSYRKQIELARLREYKKNETLEDALKVVAKHLDNKNG